MPPSKTEAAYRLLKSQIEDLTLPPGAKLGEVPLAERLGASRTPVREAIRRLAREGLVRFAPGEVAEVAPVSLAGVRALFEFRQILEPAAARLVTRDGRTDPERIAAFHSLLPDLRAVRAGIDEAGPAGTDGPADGPADDRRAAAVRTFHALTERFDQALIAAVRNPPLAKTIADTRGQTARLRAIAHAAPGRPALSLGEHLAMTEAVVAGDPDRAAGEVARHLTATLDTVMTALTRGDLPASVDVRM
ncbi:GntR family transcriptional regulator [Streptomyces bohaiensis]|uniref:GntR family transcriptional regulator n=1 Tax=Streptomyces bohaiensis TaxID=1431344 RepID=A0ABX1CA68_9ACTN|nr:GntR family transcriptional regulator [Streptomyces bohaiensis]NJQ14973.1 GntR family transcriptional regulator [Streptomyces bohaiensis]